MYILDCTGNISEESLNTTLVIYLVSWEASASASVHSFNITTQCGTRQIPESDDSVCIIQCTKQPRYFMQKHRLYGFKSHIAFFAQEICTRFLWRLHKCCFCNHTIPDCPSSTEAIRNTLHPNTAFNSSPPVPHICVGELGHHWFR